MNKLHHVDTRNPKEIVLKGLKMKVESLGELRIPFIFTMDNPSKETFRREKDGDEVAERRIVVRKPSNNVAQYAIGMDAAYDGDYLELEEERWQGWVDDITIEISVWTTSSDDRDNIVQLIKIWMLELEQDTIDDIPFFYEHGIQAVRFIRDTEEANNEWVQNGAMHIGTLTYQLIGNWFNHVEKEDLIRYKIMLEQRVVDCIRVVTAG